MNPDNLSLNKIANLIGTSPSVLSNWQKRYSDFPEPSQVIGRSRSYRLADIKAFIARHGLNVGKEDKKENKIVWASASILRSSGGTYQDVVFVIASIAYLWSNRIDDLKWLAKKGAVSEIHWPSGINMKKLFFFAENYLESIQKVLGIWVEYGKPSGAAKNDAARKVIVRDIYDYLLSANDKAGGFFLTFPSLAQLINKIGRGLEILDLTTGVGEILNTYEHEASSVWGRDVNSDAIELQLLLNCVRFGDPKRKLAKADSLRDLEQSWLNKFDVVICEPPLGLKYPVGPFSKADIRWTYYEQANIQLETDWWIQTVLAYLRPHTGDSSSGPRGIVATSDNWLYSAPEKLMRTALIRRGHIEAVISLGGGLYSGTQVPFNLIILRKTDNPTNTVRLIDATALGKVTRSTRQLSSADIAKIVEALNSKPNQKPKENFGGGQNQIISVDISLDKLFQNDSILLPRRYRPVQKPVQSPQEALAEMGNISERLKPLLETLINAIKSGNNIENLDLMSRRKNLETKNIRLGDLSKEDSRIEILFKNRQRGSEWNESDFIGGDILICLTGPQVGECMTVQEFQESNPNWVRMLQLRTGDDWMLSNYLLFWLRYGDFKEQVDRVASGTTLRTLSKNDLNRILVPFPDRELQKSLGALLLQMWQLVLMGREVAVVSELLDLKRKNFLSTVLKNIFFTSGGG